MTSRVFDLFMQADRSLDRSQGGLGIGLTLVQKLTEVHVRLAKDGIEALAVAAQHAPEVVLLDIGLPGMNGYEVASHLRNDRTLNNLLVIAISGYGQDEDLSRSKAAGCDYHLVKPIDYDQLAELLRSYFERR